MNFESEIVYLLDHFNFLFPGYGAKFEHRNTTDQEISFWASETIWDATKEDGVCFDSSIDLLEGRLAAEIRQIRHLVLSSPPDTSISWGGRAWLGCD